MQAHQPNKISLLQSYYDLLCALNFLNVNPLTQLPIDSTPEQKQALTKQEAHILEQQIKLLAQKIADLVLDPEVTHVYNAEVLKTIIFHSPAEYQIQEVLRWKLIKKTRLVEKIAKTLNGHASRVLSVAFSPDGQYIASGSDGRTIKLLNATSHQLLRTFNNYSGNISSVTFSPNGRYIASGSDDMTIKLWNTKTHALLYTFRGHTKWVKSVAFSPDGNYIASGSWDNTIKLWDVTSHQLLHTFIGHTSTVYSAVFSPDGTTLASGSADNTIKLWNVGISLTELYAQYVKDITPELHKALFEEKEITQTQISQPKISRPTMLRRILHRIRQIFTRNRNANQNM